MWEHDRLQVECIPRAFHLCPLSYQFPHYRLSQCPTLGRPHWPVPTTRLNLSFPVLSVQQLYDGVLGCLGLISVCKHTWEASVSFCLMLHLRRLHHQSSPNLSHDRHRTNTKDMTEQFVVPEHISMTFQAFWRLAWCIVLFHVCELVFVEGVLEQVCWSSGSPGSWREVWVLEQTLLGISLAFLCISIFHISWHFFGISLYFSLISLSIITDWSVVWALEQTHFSPILSISKYLYWK